MAEIWSDATLENPYARWAIESNDLCRDPFSVARGTDPAYIPLSLLTFPFRVSVDLDEMTAAKQYEVLPLL